MRKTILLKGLSGLSAAWRRRYLIAIPILVMPIIGGAVGLLAPKKYQTYTTILIQEAAKQNPFLKDLTVETNLRERMPALQSLLHSRHILAEVAFKIGLTDKETPREIAGRRIAELSAALNVKLVGDDLVKIMYESENPDRMAEVLQLVSLRFVERIIAPERSAIKSSEDFLGEELERRHKNLEIAEANLAAYKTKFAGQLPDLHSRNVTRLGNLKETLSQTKTQLNGAVAAWTDLRSRVFKTNPVIGEIEQRIVETRSELTILRSRYTDKHTLVQGALRKLNSLEDERANVLAESEELKTDDLDRLWRMATQRSTGIEGEKQPLLISQLEKLQDSESQVSNFEKQIESMEEEITKLETTVSGFGAHEKKLTELQRDLQVKRKIYQDLSERHQLARVTGALGKAEEKERVKLIDPPFTPLAPSNMPAIVFVILGLFGGVALGIGLAICAELLDLTIRYRHQLEALIDVPTLTRIPLLKVEGMSPEDGGGRLEMSADTFELKLVEGSNG